MFAGIARRYLAAAGRPPAVGGDHAPDGSRLLFAKLIRARPIGPDATHAPAYRANRGVASPHARLVRRGHHAEQAPLAVAIQIQR